MLSYVFMDMMRAIAVSIGELYSMYVLPITTKGDTSANKYITMNKIFDALKSVENVSMIFIHQVNA